MVSAHLTKVIALVGPTGVGKTEVSLHLAKQLNAEIISADSMQIYRHMDIATAKAAPEVRAQVPHHLLDIRDPGEPFSVMEYQSLARACITEIRGRGKMPLFVGGTGLYLRATLEPYFFTPTAQDVAFRTSLLQRAKSEGSAGLHAELSALDPESAAKLHVNDTRRIIRALEVLHHGGVSIAAQAERTASAAPLYDVLWIGLNRDRSELYARIEARVEQMLAAGLVEELQYLRQHYWQNDADLHDSVAGQALGYKEILPYLKGETELSTVAEALKKQTRHYARRQLIWFKGIAAMNWFMLSEGETAEETARRIGGFIWKKMPQ